VGGIIQESRAALSRYTRAASSESANLSIGVLTVAMKLGSMS
jgi:hypothetical protein